MRAAPVGTPGGTSTGWQQICALTADGLNLAGIRRVLQLQEETRQLQASSPGCANRADGTATRARPGTLNPPGRR